MLALFVYGSIVLFLATPVIFIVAYCMDERDRNRIYEPTPYKPLYKPHDDIEEWLNSLHEDD